MEFQTLTFSSQVAGLLPIGNPVRDGGRVRRAQAQHSGSLVLG